MADYYFHRIAACAIHKQQPAILVKEQYNIFLIDYLKELDINDTTCAWPHVRRLDDPNFLNSSWKDYKEL